MRRTLRPLLTGGRRLAGGVGRALGVAGGRLMLASGWRGHFHGAFPSYEAAMAAVPEGRLAGYDHEAVAEVSFEAMCRVAPWDYPVLYWLKTLTPGALSLIDAGGHMGTKYRAFRPYLALPPSFRWIVYDLPAMVAQGRRRAAEEELTGIAFVDDLSAVGRADIFLASGLLQYLDRPFSQLLQEVGRLPQHLLVNKLALRDGPTVVTLENFGNAFVPYQIRARAPFFAELESLGYRIADEWEIPSLSHIIPTHPELGASQSIGFYAVLGDGQRR
jgi:putative methyltransferase (TIGR04325 family)